MGSWVQIENSESGDWFRCYVRDELVCEGHSFTQNHLETVLEELQIEFSDEVISEEDWED